MSGESRRTYGNWRRPALSGLWRLGLAPTVVLGIVVFIALAVFRMTGGVGLAVCAAVTLPPFLLVVRPREGGTTRLQEWGAAVAGRRARRRGETVYRSGPLGLVPCGTHRLPGLLAASELSEATDTHGRPFAVLVHPHVKHLTVVIESEPDGASLADQAQVDQWVAHHGEWLARLSREPGCIACQVSVESAPDSGSRLRQMLDVRRSGSSSEYSRTVMREIRETYPAGAAEVKARIALTFSLYAAGGRRLSVAKKAEEIATRLPGLTTALASTGAGAAVPVDAQRLCEFVRIAYDPAVAETIEAARARGEVLPLSWEDVGPSSAVALPRQYDHDGAVSITWGMADAPRSSVYETVLGELLAPDAVVPRKRVTLLYRVLSRAESVRLVDSDIKASAFRVTSQKRRDFQAEVEFEAAQSTAQGVARGHPTIDVGMLVTGTTFDSDRVPDLISSIENGASGSSVNLRLVAHSQDSAFAAALPLGVWLPEYLRIPESVRRLF